MDLDKVNILGAVVSIVILALCNLIFVFRLSQHNEVEYWLGILFLLTALPLVYMLYTAGSFHRPMIYYIQIVTILIFILVELFLDYIFKIDFRGVRWMVILYVMIFFAGTGGLIGIASQVGRTWSIAAIALFLSMTALAFWQRAKSGV